MSANVEKDDRDLYLALINLHNTNRIDYNVRKWETLKFSQAVFSALLVGTLLVAVSAAEKGLLKHPGMRLLAAIPAIYAGLSALIGRANLLRESRLLFAEEATMFKLAHFLNIDKTIPPNDRWIPGDEHLLSEKWRNFRRGTEGLPEQPTFDQWIDGRMNGHRFADLYSLLFFVGVVAAGVSSFLIINYGANWNSP